MTRDVAIALLGILASVVSMVGEFPAIIHIGLALVGFYLCLYAFVRGIENVVRDYLSGREGRK